MARFRITVQNHLKRRTKYSGIFPDFGSAVPGVKLPSVSNTPWSSSRQGLVPQRHPVLLVDSKAVVPILSERADQSYLWDRSSPFYARSSGNAVMLPFAC